MHNAAKYVRSATATRARRQQPLDYPVGKPLSELEQLALVLDDPSGIKTKADRKALVWTADGFFGQAQLTVEYETELRADPVLGPWSKPDGTSGPGLVTAAALRWVPSTGQD